MHCIHDITRNIYDMSSTVYDITFTICVTSHYDYIYNITHSMFMTYPLYLASHTVLWQHNHCVTSQPLCLTSHPLYLCHHTQCIHFIKPSVWMISQPLYVWHHMYYMGNHIHSLCHHTTVLMTSQPLHMKPHPVCRATCTLYMWHHSH